jgi:hypothetical protein
MERQSVLVRVGLLVAILAGGFGLLVGALYGYRALAGAKIGGKCDGSNLDCKPGALCISRRCVQGCSTDADCPAEWACRNTNVWVTTEGVLQSRDLKMGSERICFSPDQMRGVRAEEERRAAESRAHQAQLTGILKRQEVWNAVLLKTLPLPDRPHVNVSDAAFEAAWRKIPENERVSLAADVLADRIIQTAGR